MGAWRFGHCRGILMPDGTIYAVFYVGDDTVTRAHWARFEI